MQSEKQIRTSRANGARSRGPVTEQGKRHSARNGIRNGLLAQTVVLDEEDMKRLSNFSRATWTNTSPAPHLKLRWWRLWRSLAGVSCAFGERRKPPWIATWPFRTRVSGQPVRALLALRGSPESSCPPGVLLRYEITFDRQFSRALTRISH